MNSGVNVFGQGNRANSTIGRAVQLVVRNVGGGRPGEVDRAAHGNPGKVSFCFAEDEVGSPFTSLAVSRGFAADDDTVTVFAGEGPRVHRRPAGTRPRSTRQHVRGLPAHRAPPEARDRIRLRARRRARTRARLRRSRMGPRHGCWPSCTPGCSFTAANSCAAPATWPKACPIGWRTKHFAKFRPDGLLLVHAGGGAGLFSAMIGGWANGSTGSRQPVTREGCADDQAAARSDQRTHGAANGRCCRDRRRSHGKTVGLLDISKPRGDVFLDRLEQRLDRARRQRLAVQEADVHQAGTGRPSPRDRHASAKW